MSFHEGQAYSKGVGTLPEDAEKKPVVRVDEKNFEGAADVCL